MPEPRTLTALPLADDAEPPPAISNVAMAALYRAALGPVQLPRYLALFERSDRAGRAPLGWNPVASLFTLNWLVLHQMWGAALVYLALVEGLALLVLGVGRPMLDWPTHVQCGLFTAFALFAFALPGLFGDALLHSEIRKRIQRVLAVAQTMPQACQMLARQASSQRRLGIIVVFNVLLFAILATTWALVPPGSWTSDSPAPTPFASGKVQDAAAPTLSATLTPSTLASAPALPSAPPEAPSAAAAPPEAAQPTPSANSGPAPAAPTPLDSAPAPAPAPVPAPVPVPTPVPAPAVTAEKAPKKAPEKTTKKPAEKPPKPARKKEPAPAPAAPPPTDSAAASPLPLVGSTPGYYLNVGLFAEVGNARRAQAKLLNAGLPAFRQTLSNASGERTRLRVGPYSSQAEAQRAAAQIRRMELDAVVFRQRGG